MHVSHVCVLNYLAFLLIGYELFLKESDDSRVLRGGFVMGSTGEADKKRRHVTTISPTAATAKKQPLAPLSEEKKASIGYWILMKKTIWKVLLLPLKGPICLGIGLSVKNALDAAVLQFQNQKLVQKLETQKVEIGALEDKSWLLKDKQQSYEKTLAVVDNSWEEWFWVLFVVDGSGRMSHSGSHTMFRAVFVIGEQLRKALEWLLRRDAESSSCEAVKLRTSILSRRDQLRSKKPLLAVVVTLDGESPPEDALLSRLLETGATESSSVTAIVNPTEEGRKIDGENTMKTKNILHNIVASFDDLNDLKHRLYAASLKAVSSNGQSQGVVSSDLQTQIKNLRIAVLKLHLKHRNLAGELQSHRDADAKNKADLKRLKAAVAKVFRFPLPCVGSLGELESTIAELEESNRRLAILKSERDVAKGSFFPVLNRGNKQVTSDKSRDNQRDLQDMESTRKELLEQSTFRLHELKRLHEDRLNTLRHLSSLQSNLKNVNCICSSQAYLLLKDQLAKAKADVVQYQALYEKLQVVLVAVAGSTISDLEKEIQRYIKEKDLIEAKLEEASKEPGRKEIIAEFKALVSSFPEKMGSMQNQLAKHKETAADIHCLRAHVESLTKILDRKAKDLEAMTSRSAQQNAEIQNCKQWEVSEARSSEIKAWAHVQGLKSSLDEHNLELRVKAAIEAEANAQQKLAASEAEIAELRQKLEASKREKAGLSDFLKSKHEETEAYLSEIETIGQAYDDMQTQNQQLLQQITERDDYNVKLVLEGVRARQMGDALLMEKRMLEKSVQQTKKTVDFYDFKAGRIEDQLKAYSDHMQRLAEDKVHNAAAVENTQRRLSDVRKSSQQQMGKLEEAQSQVDRSREYLAELQIELEKERFERKRVEEDVDTLRRKAQHLKSQAEGSSVAEKLQQELREYREILKCSVCLDRRKEHLKADAIMMIALFLCPLVFYSLLNVRAYKELLKRAIASVQFALQVLVLMTSNPYTSDACTSIGPVNQPMVVKMTFCMYFSYILIDLLRPKKTTLLFENCKVA
ncbi:hypothetical protein DH2020_002436 [Rehmannia glutinosa]|uniref:E3 ubiquitin protein ligase n=1 Tax=Rehmannia glutinosa TaxID=99300 RepID=A0ABR0XTQ6_REHGL